MTLTVGLSKGHFAPGSELGPAGLELCLGDNVVIMEQKGDWCRGYRVDVPAKVGLFPACYVHVKQQPSKCRLLEESLMVAEEWVAEYFARFCKLTKKDPMRKNASLSDVEELLSHMLDLRTQLVSGLTSDKFNRAERQLADSIDFGNKMLERDLVVRNSAQRVHSLHDVNIIELYRAFNEKNEQLLSKMAKFAQIRTEHGGDTALSAILDSSNESKTGAKSLYLQMKNNLCKGGDEAEFICSLNLIDHEQESFRQISDNMLLRWDVKRMRQTNGDYLQTLRGLFTDISPQEYSKKLLILIQVIRVGQMDLKTESSQFGVKKSELFSLGNKKDQTKTTNIRRPFGLCSIQYDPEVSTGAAEDERSFTVYKCPADDDDMESFTKKVIFGSSSNIQNTPIKELGKLWLQVKTLFGTTDELRKSYPGLVGKETGCRIIARRNFPDVIMPGALRNDFYVLLRRGELERCVKPNRSIQVEMSIRRLGDEVLPLSISLGEGRNENFFRSTVYKEKNPKWMELIKLEIPVEYFDKCHLLFTLRHRSSTESKDKAEKEFGFCWLPLKNKADLTIQDALYKLIVYKVTDPKRIHSTYYRTLPSTHAELPDSGDVPGLDGVQYTKDTLVIGTELCSTKIAQNEKLVGLLKWRQSQPDQLRINLDAIRNQQIKSREIMIFLQDILDALFGIMMDGGLAQFDEAIILCLCEIVQLLQNESFRHFRSVLESYLEQFAQTLVSIKLLTVLANVLERTRPEEEARKSILKAMEFLFKFIVRSEQLKQQLHDGNDHVEFDGLEVSHSFESLVVRFFDILQAILIEDANVSILPQGLILSHIPNVIDQLSRVKTAENLCQRVSAFITTIGFSKGSQISVDRLLQKRIQCIHAIVQTQFFVTSYMVQSMLADNLTNQISALLINNFETDLSVKLLQDYLVNTCQNQPCLKENIKRLLIPLVARLKSFLNRPSDEVNRCVPNLTSSLVTMLDNLNFELFEWFLLRAKQQHEEETILLDLLRLIELLYTNEVVFPDSWLQFKLYATRVTLGTIKMLSRVISKHFLNEHFTYRLWCQFFKLCVTFIKIPFIQLESYVPIKRMKIESEYGDMRIAVGSVIKDMWLNLGHYKAEFIPELVPDIFRVTLTKVEAIQKDAIFLLFDMINYETLHTRHFQFKKFEEAIVSATDQYFNHENGDYQYVELFVQTLSTLCLRHEKLQYSGLDFIRKMNILMKLLLEYREVDERQKDVDDQMMCIEKLLKFFSDEDFGFNRRDLYTTYIYKLYAIHLGAKNYNEAAFTLLEHAKRLTWSSTKQLDTFTKSLVATKLDFSSKEELFEWDLKEELYERTIWLFEIGKMWEEAIKCCKELENEYEHAQVDFVNLSSYLEIRARLTAKIVGNFNDAGDSANASVRSSLPYFFVGFFGQGHDEHLSNHTFIYRGVEYERLEDFADQLASRFPRARRLPYTHPPDDEVKQSKGQYLQIFLVQPVANIPEQLRPPKPVSAKIIDFYRFNQITDFTYDRPYQKGEKDKTNEFASMWIERRFYKVYGRFPGILRWFEIEETKVHDISPLQNAIDTVRMKNESLLTLVNEFSSGHNANTQQLQMTLSGTIDPAVSGGFANYDRAFFGSFLENASHDEKRQTNELKQHMSEQVPILEQLLEVHHEKVVKRDMKAWSAFHENLARKLSMLKVDVEAKYGTYGNGQLIRRNVSSLTRRESKRNKRNNSRPGSASNSQRNSTIADNSDTSFMSYTSPDAMVNKPQGTLPRVKKALTKTDSKSGSQSSTLKRDRSKRISVNIENFKSVKDNMKDNVRGTFNTLAKAAQKLQKQISTDDVNTSSLSSNHASSNQSSMPGKTQSQIELRENATNIRPRRPKSQCRSRPESWGDQSTEKEGLKIFKSSDNIFDDPIPPPLPRKHESDQSGGSGGGSGRVSASSQSFPILPPKKLPEKPSKSMNVSANNHLPPRKPPLPTKTKFNF